jgi:hypothetical protein
MLVIRNDQIKPLEESAVHDFENELVEHCWKFAPKHSEVITDDGVRKVVERGLERSKIYGFTNRGPIRFYVEMMFMFGSDFDTDLQLPWAGGVLNNESIPDQTQRADILHDNLVEYLEQVSGPDDQYALDALRRLNQTRIEEFESSGGDFDKKMTSALRSIYPQKCDYLGDELLRKLLRRGHELADSHQIKSGKGRAVFIALMFAIGHGFADDPLFPWISATLADETLEPDKKAARVYKKMKIYLEEALKNLEQMRK